MFNLLIKYLIFIIIGYLSGSIMFGYLIPKIMKNIDVRLVSSDKNPGTANAFINGGVVCGIITLILELLKGFLPIYLSQFFLDYNHLLFIFVMISPVLGHAFPIYNGFKKGGKCIAVSFGVLLGLIPYITPILLLSFWYIFFSIILVINPHSLRTLITFICFIICSLFIVRTISILIGSIFISFVVILKHLKSVKKLDNKGFYFIYKKHET